MPSPSHNQEGNNAGNTRRTLLTRLGILAAFPLLAGRFFKRNKKDIIACAPEKKPSTARFLTQDGKLVEVNIAEIKAGGEKISDQELIAWVKK